ncbi:hypothetical protein HanXRQr2_Chr09g0383851 [Helianthus annuus]|uniref:Uncharacterized protein n=2 Tax=Helianthus annuus TaxID=4232 RepID=A0A9K3N856_HELAN|nr:hypothetical protein HanXRQr2_Chr09g0383851 [Helianthus annuus]
MQMTTTSSVNPYINTRIVKLENVTVIPILLLSTAHEGFYKCIRVGPCHLICRFWWLFISPNRSLFLMMCNQARNLILLHRRLWLIHIKIDHRRIYRGDPQANQIYRIQYTGAGNKKEEKNELDPLNYLRQSG